MKTGWKVILVSLAAAIMLLAAQSPCRGAEKDDANNVWVEDGPARPNMPLELTDEKVEQSMEWLEENNPQQAQKLTQLRKDDPEKFRQELREATHEQFGKKNQGTCRTKTADGTANRAGKGDVDAGEGSRPFEVAGKKLSG